ncbi:MAG: TIGR02186 family protein, partial [Pacificimonas sp.]
MRAALALLLALVAIPTAAQAPPRLIADLSQSRIDIIYSFAGAEILVFGAIQYPDGSTPEERPDLVIVVRGPPKAVTVRRKERVLGLWLNTDAVRFETAPSFYRAASTRPVEELVDETTAAIFELSPQYLQLSPTGATDAGMIGTFEQGLL